MSVLSKEQQVNLKQDLELTQKIIQGSNLDLETILKV
jgi:hypothetical protein